MGKGGMQKTKATQRRAYMIGLRPDRDKTKQDKTRQGTTRQDKTNPDKDKGKGVVSTGSGLLV